MDLSQKGLRERIKKAATPEEAQALIIIARARLEGKALRRCEKAFEERKGK